MNILLGCDVDPVLPRDLRERPRRDPWSPLGRIDDLLKAAGSAFPSVTWLLRSDASVRFATGNYASGYLARREFWEGLRARGHELGWHMHLMSRDARSGRFRFDPEPAWLAEAHGALSEHFPVNACRTGWDYGSNFLFRSLDELGVKVDFSALPGNRTWFRLGNDAIEADWLRCVTGTYHPDSDDYQRPGETPLKLLEVPIALFPNGPLGIAQRSAWRLVHGCFSIRGMGGKARAMTEGWPSAPRLDSKFLAFSFHPDDLTETGIRNFLRNWELLRELPEAEFVTASEAARRIDEDADSRAASGAPVT